jgi:hypothetical protein
MAISRENVNFRFMICFGEPARHRVKSAWQTRANFHFFKRRGGKISSGVQAAPLSKLQQGFKH